MIDTIKVAYDSSLLGLGHISNQSRTGIFRVVEEILLKLHKRDDILIHALSLNQDSTIIEDISSFLYFENEHPELLYRFRESYLSKLSINDFYSVIVKTQRRLISASNSRRSLQYKAGRVLQAFGSQLAKRESCVSASLEDYDIYHSSYFPLCDGEILSNASRILTVYDLIPILFPEFVVPAVYQRSLRMLQSINIEKDWVICISEHTKQDFCEYTGMNPSRVFVTPLAASDWFYSVENSSIISEVLEKYRLPRKPYILSLCTLEPRKNIELLIKAFSDLVQANPAEELNLVLVGISGWKNKSIFDAVQKNSVVRDRIFCTGYLPDQDLAPIYSGALMFVYPSLYEGFGLPPLEAMQCGIPVITSDVSSLPEVVGDAGILFDPRSKTDLCHAMWSLVENSHRRQELSQISIERASKFTWKQSVEETVRVYKTAV